MPQIAQLTQDSWYLLSQIFWLVIVFAAIYAVIGRGMLPKVQSTIEQRVQKIAEDVALAKDAQQAATELKEQYHTTEANNRAAAQQRFAEATRVNAEENTAKIAKAEKKFADNLDKAEESIAAAQAAAMQNITSAASELTYDILSHLSAVEIPPKQIAAAVQSQIDK